MTKHLTAGQELEITSSTAKFFNRSGYHLLAPHNHRIKASCNYTKGSNDGEFLHVQTDYTHNDDGGQSIFVSSNFTKTSLFNHLIIVMRNTTSSISDDDAASGRFECRLQVEKRERCDCGWGRPVDRRIVNGSETERNEFPSVVAMIHVPSNYTFCGGTIIHPRYILSAAHCFVSHTYRNRYEVKILLGAHNYHDKSTSSYHTAYQFEKIITHPNYETTEQDNDILLLKLTREIIFSRGVGPACLPWKFVNYNFYDDDVQMVGWGTTTWHGQLSQVPRKVTLKVMDTDICDKKIVWVNEKKLCTYAEQRDGCQSDSGGPVYYTSPADNRQYVVGIISFGIRCATKSPGVNTRVTNYLAWIAMTVEENERDAFCAIE
ncbi:venom serine protease-like [Culicoides brevitarsis]|uniref:venom serine protease-like n=1 Tax=Culicoides brevitarsis TaxID=469753 RepID=UPI00307C2CEB